MNSQSDENEDDSSSESVNQQNPAPETTDEPSISTSDQSSRVQSVNNSTSQQLSVRITVPRIGFLDRMGAVGRSVASGISDLISSNIQFGVQDHREETVSEKDATNRSASRRRGLTPANKGSSDSEAKEDGSSPLAPGEPAKKRRATDAEKKGERIEEAITECGGLQTKNTENIELSSAENALLKKRIAEMEERIARMEQENAEKQAKLVMIQDEKAKEQARLAMLEKEAAEEKKIRSEEQEKCALLEKESAELKRKLAELEKAISPTAKTNATDSTAIDEAEEAYEHLVERLEKTKDDNKRLESSINNNITSIRAIGKPLKRNFNNRLNGNEPVRAYIKKSQEESGIAKLDVEALHKVDSNSYNNVVTVLDYCLKLKNNMRLMMHSQCETNEADEGVTTDDYEDVSEQSADNDEDFLRVLNDNNDGSQYRTENLNADGTAPGPSQIQRFNDGDYMTDVEIQCLAPIQDDFVVDANQDENYGSDHENAPHSDFEIIIDEQPDAPTNTEKQSSEAVQELHPLDESETSDQDPSLLTQSAPADVETLPEQQTISPGTVQSSQTVQHMKPLSNSKPSNQRQDSVHQSDSNQLGGPTGSTTSSSITSVSNNKNQEQNQSPPDVAGSVKNRARNNPDRFFSTTIPRSVSTKPSKSIPGKGTGARKPTTVSKPPQTPRRQQNRGENPNKSGEGTEAITSDDTEDLWYTWRCLMSEAWDQGALPESHRDWIEKTRESIEEKGLSKRIEYKDAEKQIKTCKAISDTLIKACSRERLSGNQKGRGEESSNTEVQGSVDVKRKKDEGMLVEADDEMGNNQDGDEEKTETAPQKTIVKDASRREKCSCHLLTSGFKNDMIDAPGERIVEQASNVFNSREETNSPNIMAAKGFQVPLSRSDGCSEPVVELGISDGDLEQKATSVPVCLIKDCNKKYNFHGYSPEKLLELSRTEQYRGVTVGSLRQRPQPTHQNKDFNGNEDPFRPEFYNESRPLTKVLENHKKVLEISKNGFKEWSKRNPDDKKFLLQLHKELKNAQLPFKDSRGKQFPITTFGSNIDIGETDLMTEIRKLPLFTQPKNLLMRFLSTNLPGINLIQVYVKGPGCRTPAHYENQGIGSININLGPDDCIWFTVSMDHAAQLEKLFSDKGLNLYEDTIWPSEEELKKAGIPYSKFVQKAGEMVFVNTGTYHWVQSTGFCTNISWNIILEDTAQLAAAAIFHDDNAYKNSSTALPMNKLIWNIAKAQFKKDPVCPEFSGLVKRLLASSLAYCQMEIETAEKNGFVVEIIDQNVYGIEDINICGNKLCRRNNLFNMFLVKNLDAKEGEKNEAKKRRFYCVNCAPKDKTIRCFIVHEISKLIEIHNNY